MRRQAAHIPPARLLGEPLLSEVCLCEAARLARAVARHLPLQPARLIHRLGDLAGRKEREESTAECVCGGGMEQVAVASLAGMPPPPSSLSCPPHSRSLHTSMRWASMHALRHATGHSNGSPGPSPAHPSRGPTLLTTVPMVPKVDEMMAEGVATPK